MLPFACNTRNLRAGAQVAKLTTSKACVSCMLSNVAYKVAHCWRLQLTHCMWWDAIVGQLDKSSAKGTSATDASPTVRVVVGSQWANRLDSHLCRPLGDLLISYSVPGKAFEHYVRTDRAFESLQWQPAACHHSNQACLCKASCARHVLDARAGTQALLRGYVRCGRVHCRSMPYMHTSK